MSEIENAKSFVDGVLIRVEDLHKSFNGRPVLCGVNLDIPLQGTTVVLGGSGAGKSVLLKHLNGLIKPDSGRILVDGEDIAKLPEKDLAAVRRRIAIVFQHGALFDSLSVGENIAFPLREAGMRHEGEIAARVAGVLGKVGLAGEEAKMPDRLSGGMIKRAALARSLAMAPECLLYDEPTAGLDPILSQVIVRLIHELKVSERNTSVLVTHHMGAMRALADQVVFLSQGVVRFTGMPEDLEQSDDEKVREFLDADATTLGD